MTGEATIDMDLVADLSWVPPCAGDPALERATLLKPGDDAPRLVYADWLQERGDERWAALAHPKAREWTHWFVSHHGWFSSAPAWAIPYLPWMDLRHECQKIIDGPGDVGEKGGRATALTIEYTTVYGVRA